jgi:hypothetical protein
MVYFIRKVTANFMIDPKVRDMEINGLSLDIAASIDSEDGYEGYIREIVMKFGHDALGLLHNIIPLALQIDISIVNVDT